MFHSKSHENPSTPPNIGGFVAPCFTWIAVSCFLRLRSFTQGVFFAAISAGKKNQVPDLQSIESCSKPLTGVVFPKKNIGGWFRHGLIFFWKALISERNLLEAFFISKNQWDPMATSSWSFDPATSWGQLALEYIYIYILLGIGSITLSHEFPRLLNPTTPGIVIRFPQCHNIGNLMLGQVCGLLSDPISPELSFGQWQCIYFKVYLYVSNVNLEMFIQTCGRDFHPHHSWCTKKFRPEKISKVQASLPPHHLPACRPLRQTSLLKTSVWFFERVQIFGWKQKILWSWWYVRTHLWNAKGPVVQLEKKTGRLVKVGPASCTAYL